MYVYVPFIYQLAFGMEVKIKTHKNLASQYGYVAKAVQEETSMYFIHRW